MSQDSIPTDDSDDDLRAADELLGKADALLRRHNLEAEAPAPNPLVSLDEDDLPLLTDIVDPSELPAELTPASSGQPTATDDLRLDRLAEPSPDPHRPGHPAALPGEPRPFSTAANEVPHRHPASLDAALRDAVETWFATMFPQLLSRELDAFSARLQQETLAQLRAALSARPDDRDDEADAPR